MVEIPDNAREKRAGCFRMRGLGYNSVTVFLSYKSFVYRVFMRFYIKHRNSVLVGWTNLSPKQSYHDYIDFVREKYFLWLTLT